ncbi:hypothetical protein A3B21_02730 [Candidatus Uhrbacteria bacterium RIFCSPLOWO2_01_FULL_47_24]|uniref:Uncharacterized protein n=1 Tax=Candidatus Uhrbacteria bacterium RIFCSPLOWO2_01_FULL_47_24 TaxID=1802401 RepID=A0A1F7USA4_9BACT|nr:MAG: hypothetical protein A2753_04350 [Candidatus Uhrbacteria bacterium RIFCSPHIGHO2_01_FULL_47_11]OGL68612.1 MAG: hypothetical protein A3D58_01755 [Candidatus Uhrbacteria bacterium RIFCSPHIGHO2_02_FULL_46_47]OGL81180.1 MAG: hypothetical protein A3B21_02730 [Candidatus Uhrbacteria bacterium RIFCSPLOWO2_01_FULL_47_24]
MKTSKILSGGIIAGVAFYALSMLIWALFKFLPVVPLSIAIPAQGLGRGWQIEHFLVSLFIGVMWGFGYLIYGTRRASGWLYGATLFIVGSLPSFVTYFIISPPLRSIIFYGAIISFIGALLGGKIIAAMAKK